MNEKLWGDYLKLLTGDYAREFNCPPSGGNHLDLTFQYFKDRGLDVQNKFFLDLGCGAKAQLANHIAGIWVGFDLMPPEEGAPDYHVGDAHQLPFHDKVFNVVFSSHTLEHLLSPLIALWEIRRVLKDDGDVILGVPCAPGFMGDDHNYVLTRQGWELLARRARFKIVDGIEAKNCLCLHLRKEERQ